jgi:hypothetical protein
MFLRVTVRFAETLESVHYPRKLHLFCCRKWNPSYLLSNPDFHLLSFVPLATLWAGSPSHQASVCNPALISNVLAVN